MSRLLLVASLCLLLLVAAAPAFAADPPAKKIPVLVDVAFGNGLDYAYAMADILARPEIEVVGITTSCAESDKRAQMIGRFLSAAKRRDIPFAAGAEPQVKGGIDLQHQYQYHPAVVFNRMGKAEKEPAADFLATKLKARPGEITVLTLGPLTNIARMLVDHPESAKAIKRIVVFADNVDYPPIPKAEFFSSRLFDKKAFDQVLRSGVPIDLLTKRERSESNLIPVERSLRLFDPPTLVSLQLESIAQMESALAGDNFGLESLEAVAALAGEDGFGWAEKRVRLDGDGRLVDDKEGSNVRIASTRPKHSLVDATIERLKKYSDPAPRPELANRAELVERGNFPARVHAFEDYETDIEKRWWMTGRLRTEKSADSEFRYCQGILTQDFDDRQGNMDAMYNGVVFNPVPGPPMGPKTRLTFRYYLEGTDTLRVQLYSLSNGYHRYLTVTGLPQKEWREGTVDMTKMLRPDGTGGPLTADERIDDIQFYVDCRATVKIDYMILYDAADEKETRHFPKRLLFTGWFDTGKQGNEWPGTFEILPHEKPRSWKFAQSVPNEKLKKNWIRIDLRGPRPLGDWTHLLFDYRIEGPKDLEIRIVDANGKALAAGHSEVGQDKWSHEDFIFPTKAGAQAREIWFLVPPEGKLQLDDLLLSDASQE